MKRFTKTALFAAGVALACQGTYAGPNNNDLILDINANSATPAGTTEFNVNLGTQATLTTPGQDLSSFLSGFSSYNSAAASGLNFGVAGGQNGQGGLSGAGNDVFMTTLRTASGVAFTSPGSAAPTAGNPGKAAIGNAGGVAGGFSGYGNNVSTSDSTSFSVNVASSPTANGSFANFLRASPLSTMSGQTITLDLWRDTVTSSGTTGWTYQGDLTLDLSGATPKLIWDQVTAVPEPSTYGVIAGAGLLVLSLRRQLFRNA